MQHLDGVAWGVAEGIGRIVLQRAEQGNSMTFESTLALIRAIDEILDAKPRVVLLSAEGRMFCSGANIGDLVGTSSDMAGGIDTILTKLHPAVLRLANAPVPVVAAVNGPMAGAGVGLGLCADFVLGAASMKLRTGYAALGVTPDLGASYFLSRRIGTVRAKQWLMLSEAFDAAQCLQAGVVDALHPADELAAAAEALIEKLARSAPGAMGGIRQLCNALQAGELRAHLELEREILTSCARSDDFQEGVRAFSEKRAPAFKGC